MTGCTALKSLQVQHVPQCTTPNIESCFHLREKTIQDQLERAHFPVIHSGLALPNTVKFSATLSHQASNDVWSHLISVLKDETTFETGKQTQTMAAAKAAIRTSKKIALTNRNSSASQIQDHTSSNQTHHSQKPRNKASDCKPHQVTSMEHASLVWNSEMHCIFDIIQLTQYLHALRWLWS